MSVLSTVAGREPLERWPHIRRYLRVEPSGRIEGDYLSWYFASERVSLPCLAVAAAYEEWADFCEWRQQQRATESTDDEKRDLAAEEWSDSMAYTCRRCAAWARGEDPGEWVPQRERRPDLHAARQARMDEMIAKLGADRAPAGLPALRKAG